MTDIFELLRNKKYPGRGIIIGKSASGQILCAYFTMGRSETSRARVFVPDGDGVVIRTVGGAAGSELTVYSPVRVLEGVTIVANGDQSDTIYESLRLGGSFESALRGREYEPDGPHYTPRISGLIEPDGTYRLSILRRGGEPGNVLRYFYEYAAAPVGEGRFISTYTDDGNPLPSFAGEPVRVGLPDVTVRKLADMLWESLNEDNRVSLLVRGGTETVIINRYDNDRV